MTSSRCAPATVGGTLFRYPDGQRHPRPARPGAPEELAAASRRHVARLEITGAIECSGKTVSLVAGWRDELGTLRKEKAPDGTAYVRLNGDRSRSDGDDKRDKTADRSTVEQVLREQVAQLREQPDQEREANRENRRIEAGLVQRIPELDASASPEPQEPPTPATEEPDRGRTPPVRRSGSVGRRAAPVVAEAAAECVRGVGVAAGIRRRLGVEWPTAARALGRVGVARKTR